MDQVSRRYGGVTFEIVNIFVAVEGGTVWKKTKFRKVSQCRKTERGDTLGFLKPILSQNIKKLKGGKIFIFGKKSHNAEKKLKRGTLWDFSTSILSQNSKKVKGYPLVSRGMVYYAGKQEKHFWISSLGQMVQFGAIIFCRTFKTYFDQFGWIEKM